jgi:hypothetical protein
MFSDPVLWSKIVIRGCNPSKAFSTVWKSVLPVWDVYKWTGKLKNGCTSVTHEEGAGLPYMATAEDNVEHAHNMILSDE